MMQVSYVLKGPFWKAIWQDVPGAWREFTVFHVVFSYIGTYWGCDKKKKENAKERSSVKSKYVETPLAYKTKSKINYI